MATLCGQRWMGLMPLYPETILHKVFIEIIIIIELKNNIYWNWYLAWNLEYLIVIFDPLFEIKWFQKYKEKWITLL